MPPHCTSSWWSVVDPRTTWGQAYLALLLLRCYSAFFGHAYIHPDEWMQSGEPYFGLTVPGLDLQLPWEWRPDQALRSFSTLHIKYCAVDWMLYALERFGPPSGHALFLIQRAGMLLWTLFLDLYVVLSFPPRMARYLLCLFGVSTAATTFMVRPFSNTHEALYLAASFMQMLTFCKERTWYKRGGASVGTFGVFLAITNVDGFFTRFTYAIFALPLAIVFIYHSARIAAEGYPRPAFVSLAIVVGTSLVALYLRIESDTDFYTRSGKAHGIQVAGFWGSKCVIAPINALLYNIKTENVANHGLHPRWLHAVVNLPMMVGVANCVVLFIQGWHSIRGSLTWSAAETSSQSSPSSSAEAAPSVPAENSGQLAAKSAEERKAVEQVFNPASTASTTTSSQSLSFSEANPSSATEAASPEAQTASEVEIDYVDMEPFAVGLSLSIIVFALAILSISPHQEPRFLLPLAFPSTVIMAYALQSRYFTLRPYLVRVLVVLHVVQHLLQLLFFSLLHQGGLLPALFSIDHSISLLPRHGDPLFERFEHHILYRTFSIPYHLLPNKGGGTFARIQEYDSSSTPAHVVYMAGIACNHTWLYAPSWTVHTLQEEADYKGRVELVKVDSFSWHVDTDHLGESWNLVKQVGFKQAFAIQKLEVRCKTHRAQEAEPRSSDGKQPQQQQELQLPHTEL